MEGQQHAPAKPVPLTRGGPEDLDKILHLTDPRGPRRQLQTNAGTSSFHLSANWSGYALTNATNLFTEVLGVWKVPEVSQRPLSITGHRV
jgi:hypothetical protein